MAMGVHGEPTIDIHTGGEDNIFPHHECEIAQSSGATGRPFAKYWMHVRFLLVEGEKMSKSKGNFYTVRDLLGRGIDPAVLRYELLKTHYRANMNFTAKGLEDSTKAVAKLRLFAGHAEPTAAQAVAGRMGDSAIERRFADALADDLNMSAALGELFGWINATHNPSSSDIAAIRRIDGVLAVVEPSEAVGGSAGGGAARAGGGGLSDEQIEAKAQEIREARARKDFAASDRLRDELLAADIEVQIGKDGVKWRRKVKL
jgi:cysteinyl-tRNA synthetase